MHYKKLYKALLLLENEQEAEDFLKDLCTPKELRDMAERLNIAEILNERQLSYQQINAKTGSAIATIGRVARFLRQEQYGGYRKMLAKLKEQKAE